MDNKLYLNTNKWYKEQVGNGFSVSNPTTLNQKLQWLKVFEYNKTKTLLADKVSAFEWVKRKIGKEYIIPIIGEWDSVEDIMFEEMPEKFVLMAAHGTEKQKIVLEKPIEEDNIKKILRDWMRTNYAYESNQMEYENVRHRIIAQPYYSCDMHISFWCFNGNPEFVTLFHSEKGNATYNLDWEKQNYYLAGKKNKNPIKQPEHFNDITDKVRILCRKFSFVKIDFLLKNETFYFDQLSFSPDDGVVRWRPRKTNKQIGNLLQLPKNKSEWPEKIINIKHINCKFQNDTVCVEYDICIDEKKYQLRYDIEGKIVNYEIASNIDAALLPLLLFAVKRNYKIISEYPISQSLYENIAYIMVKRMETCEGSGVFGFDSKVPLEKDVNKHGELEARVIQNRDNRIYVDIYNDIEKANNIKIKSNICEIIQEEFDGEYYYGQNELEIIGTLMLLKKHIKKIHFVLADYSNGINWARKDDLQYPAEWFISVLLNRILDISFENKDGSSILSAEMNYSYKEESERIHLLYRMLMFFTNKEWKKDLYAFLNSVNSGETWESEIEKYNKKLIEVFPDIEKRPCKKKYLYIKFRLQALLFGMTVSDYFLACYNRCFLYGRAVCTRRRVRWLEEVLNDWKDMVFVKDKRCFALQWSNYFNRKWCDNTCDLDEFVQKFYNVKKVIVKPLNKFGGSGIRVFEINSRGIEEVYDAIRCNYPKSFIAEEYFEQDGFLHSLNASSMNTIRVITIRNPYNGNVYIANAFLRVGKPGQYVDNYSSGGVTYALDRKTGQLGTGISKDSKGKVWDKHPGTDRIYTGLVIPNWNQVMEICVEAHKKAPLGLNCIGWDVCKNENSCMLIEANSTPGFGRLFDKKDNQWEHVKSIINLFLE